MTHGQGATDQLDGEDISALVADLSTQRMARGAKASLIGNVVERMLGLGLFIALPFLIPFRTLGVYYEVVAVLTLASTVGTLGLDVGVVRFTALAGDSGNHGHIRSVLKTGLLMAAVSSFALAVALWVAAPTLGGVFHSGEFAGALRLGVLAVPILATLSVLVAPGKGVKSMWPAVVSIQMTQPAVQLAATAVLAAGGLALGGAAGAFVVSAAVSWAVGWMMLCRLRLPKGEHSARPSAGPLVRFSAPVAGMVLTGTLLLWVDTLLLGAFRSPTEVAAYGIVVRLVAAATGVLATVIQIFGPFVTQLVTRGDLSRLRDVLHTATRWTFLLSAPLLVLLMLVGPGLLGLFRRPLGSARVGLVVLAVAFLADALTGPVGYVLSMSGRSRLNLANNAAAVVGSVALNLVLMPGFGIVGAAVSWAVAIVGVNLIRMVQVWRLYRITPFGPGLWKPAVAAAGAAVAGWGMKEVLAFRGVGSGPVLGLVAMFFLAVYGGITVFLGVEPDDRVLVRTLVRRRASAPRPVPVAAGVEA